MYVCVYTYIPHHRWLLPTHTTVDFSINRVYMIPLNSQSCEGLQRCPVAIVDYQKWSNAIEKNPLQNKPPQVIVPHAHHPSSLF